MSSYNLSLINCLAIEGGGVKGIASAGALLRLDELGVYKNIKRISGSSAGAICAGAIAVEYSAQEIVDVLKETDFKQFEDDSSGYIRDAFRLFNKYGIAKGDAFFKWYGEIMYKKTGNKNITFQEVYDKFGNDLIITGTNVDKQKTVYFSYKTHPDMAVRQAVRISMSIPFFYEPVKYNDDLYVDGGVLQNYPIDVFDDVNTECNPCAIGILLVSEDEIQHKELDTGSVIKFGMAIVNGMLNQLSLRHISSQYWKQTIKVNTFDISSTNFSLTKEQQNRLLTSGYTAVEKWLNTKK